MVDRHYDDEALIAILESGAACDADPHLLACRECRETFDELRAISCALAEVTVWQPPADAAPNPRTIATLRAYADQMTAEDAAAEALLPALLADASLAAQPEYQTAGVVRQLLAAADRAIDNLPPEAVRLTSLATAIADALDAARYESDAVAKLRGAAWRDYAYALYYTGSFVDAEKAVFRAESHFSDCRVGEYEGARVAFLHAMNLRAVGELDVARERTAAAGRRFLSYGDEARAASTRSFEAALAYKAGDVRRALGVWLELEKNAGADTSAEAVARLLPNIGLCYRDLGEFEKAMEYFALSAAIWDDLCVPAEAARLRWNVASLYGRMGRHRDAVEQLLRVKRDFENAGMLAEAALTALEAAEQLSKQNDPVMVAELCRVAMRHFTQTGLNYSEPALKALSYLQEAATSGRATERLVGHVRSYLRRLPEEPQLLFAPPPA